MGWLFFIIFIATWFCCFIFSYKLLYFDWMEDVGSCGDGTRFYMILVSSLHILGVTCAIVISMDNLTKKILGKRKKLGKDNFIIKMVKRLEK